MYPAIRFHGTAMGRLIHRALNPSGFSTGRYGACARLLLGAGAHVDEASLPNRGRCRRSGAARALCKRLSASSSGSSESGDSIGLDPSKLGAHVLRSTKGSSDLPPGRQFCCARSNACSDPRRLRVQSGLPRHRGSMTPHGPRDRAP
jgi:hypothetical protein